MEGPRVVTVGVTGTGTYLPDERLSGADVAERSGVPEDVVTEKMGVREKRVCPPDDDHPTDMCVAAARDALADADCDPADLDLVLYHGSEYKDHVVWSAAATITERLGAADAYATESYTLCAGMPVALRGVRAQVATGDVERALLVAASREEDLVDYDNPDSSFMFNFGSGACATVVERLPATEPRALVRESAALTDGSFADDVVVPAGGSRQPPSHGTVAAGLHTLDVPDPDGMKERLGEVSLENFLAVADESLVRSGYDRTDVDFLAVVHTKRSFHEALVDSLGLDPATDAYYLDEYGHVQSVDQVLAVEAGLDRGLIDSGDVVLCLAAGTGYTWAATTLDWVG